MHLKQRSKYMKQNLTQLHEETDNSLTIFVEFNTLFSVADRTTRKKIKKEREDLKTLKSNWT
jgi:uncharacterized surface protein with fasciclin (FAS1) repeats